MAYQETNDGYLEPDFIKYPVTGFSSGATLGSSGYLYLNEEVLDPTLGRNTMRMVAIRRGSGDTCYPCYDKD